MLSLNYENINYVMTQILKLSYASFSYVNISYVLAIFSGPYLLKVKSPGCLFSFVVMDTCKETLTHPNFNYKNYGSSGPK